MRGLYFVPSSCTPAFSCMHMQRQDGVLFSAFKGAHERVGKSQNRAMQPNVAFEMQIIVSDESYQ